MLHMHLGCYSNRDIAFHLNVDEITDKQMIIEWLEVIKPEYLKLLHNRLEDTVQWGPDFKYKYNCKDCGQAREVVAPMNPLAFFT